MTRRALTILICAVETSGDNLGGALMAALKARHQEIRFVGCGGVSMRDEGLVEVADATSLAVVGPVDALKVVPAAFSIARKLGDVARRDAVDAAIFIDSWSFSKLAVKEVRKKRPQAFCIKYVSPQIWASRPERAAHLADNYDGLLSLFPFEEPLYAPHNIDVRAIGHSVFQGLRRIENRADEFREKYAIGKAPLLALLPGSRRMEVERLTPSFQEIVLRLHDNVPGLRVAIGCAPGRDAQISAFFENLPTRPLIIEPAEKIALFDAADAALAASGTVSTELALRATPMVIAYKVHPLTAFWGRRVITTPYASLINIAAGREIIPEFIQERLDPHAMAKALKGLLTDDAARMAQLEAFEPALSALGADGADAATRGAKAVLEWLVEA